MPIKTRDKSNANMSRAKTTASRKTRKVPSNKRPGGARRRRGFAPPIDRATVESIMRRRSRGESVSQIAVEIGRDKRTVEEAERAMQAVPQIANRVAKDGGIMVRPASRATKLPKSIQRKIAPKLVGQSVPIGVGIVQAFERKLGIVQPGRKAGSGPGPKAHVRIHLHGLTKMPVSKGAIQMLKRWKTEIDMIINALEPAR